MNRYIITSLVVIITLSLAGCGKSSIAFNKLEHDFGAVKQNTVVREIFSFTNNGEATLVIIDIKSSCGCTGTVLDKKIIPPGETGKIEVAFNSGTFKGKVTRAITVHSNDPLHQKIKLKISADVIPNR